MWSSVAESPAGLTCSAAGVPCSVACGCAGYKLGWVLLPPGQPGSLNIDVLSYHVEGFEVILKSLE